MMEVPHFTNLPNFRQIEGTRLYRSSRPDKLTVGDLDRFWSLGLKSVIDLRSMREYPSASGTKLLSDYFVPTTAFPKRRPGGGAPVVNYNTYSKRGTPEGAATSKTPKYPGLHPHFMVDLLSTEYGWAVFERAGLLVKIYLSILYMFDCVFRTNVFLRSLVRYVINADGLYGQYRDLVRYAGAKVFTALTLVADPDNTPVLICCTYGKDRTGIIVALILRLMGHSKVQIAEDYCRSEPEMKRLEAELSCTIRQYNFSRTFATAERDTMIQLLDFIDDTYGGIHQYLERIGIDHGMQKSIINNLTGVFNNQSAYPRRQSMVPTYRQLHAQ